MPNPAACSQDELRRRRRASQRVVYTGDFSLSDEVAAICEPLAEAVSALPRPGSAMVWVCDLAEAVHEAVSTIVGWLAEADARATTKHLADQPSRRANAVRLLVDLTERPPLPEVSAEDLTSGRWAADLVKMAAPYTAPLAELLSHSYPPDAFELRGTPSRSERLERLLRETFDRAALSLREFIKRAAITNLAHPLRLAAQTDPGAARAELAKLGIEAP